MYVPLLMPDLREMLRQDDAHAMSEFCVALHAGIVAEVLEELENREAWRVLSCCGADRQVEILKFLSLPRQIEIVSTIEREPLSKLIEKMAPDDRVDLLERMDPGAVESLMPLIAQAERSDIRELLSYPEDSAGSIMTTEYASLPEEITAAEALERLRRQAPDRETIYYVYILDEGRRLNGFTSLQDIILAKPESRLSEIMRRDVIRVNVDDDQEDVAQELARYDFLAIPVVDSRNQLVGIVTHDDVLDILQEEASEDAYRLAAVEPLEDSYLETSLKLITWKRGSWLLFLGVVALGTALVLEQYEEVTETYKWMVLFLPLVVASGGNAGSQSATLVIRALATDELTRQESLQLVRREFVLGGVLATGVATLGFVGAMAFHRSHWESLVVAVTVFLVVMMGAISGVVLPLTFKKLGMDPAMMSTPLIAALIDIVGVLTYYSVALLVL